MLVLSFLIFCYTLTLCCVYGFTVELWFVVTVLMFLVEVVCGMKSQGNTEYSVVHGVQSSNKTINNDILKRICVIPKMNKEV